MKGKGKLIFTHFSLLFIIVRHKKQIFRLKKASDISGEHFSFGNYVLPFFSLLLLHKNDVLAVFYVVFNL